MARFVYRMQSILNIKIQMENQAKMEFGQTQRRLLEKNVWKGFTTEKSFTSKKAESCGWIL